jgi:hypothetical protein
MNVNELTQMAILGTARSPLPPMQSDPAPLSAALKAAASAGGAEDQLLAAAAIYAAYETCGATPPAAKDPPAPAAPSDARPSCSRAAGDLLWQILSLTNTATKQQLAVEWCTAADRTAQRVPHALLPPLLDYAAATRAVREVVQQVIDHRGQWLIAQNPRWQFAAGAQENVESLWTTANADQRAAALKRLRESDPLKARQLVESTWKEDGADERASFIEAMRTGLSLEDEAFLETALDDRSKQVRAAAAELLSSLAGSQLVARMIARVEPLLSFKPKTAAGILKRSKPAEIRAELPPDNFDPPWARDGVIEKPASQIGRRQWWLQQMLAAVPPSHWSSKWDISPADAVAGAAGDYAGVLIDAWTKAAERHRDIEWIAALLAHPPRDRAAMPKYDLLKQLPPQRQQAMLQALLIDKLDASALARILGALSGEVDPDRAEALIAAVEREVASTGVDYNYALSAILEALVHRLPPQVYESLLTRWTGPVWEANRKALDNFFSTLSLRRNIMMEFAP